MKSFLSRSPRKKRRAGDSSRRTPGLGLRTLAAAVIATTLFVVGALKGPPSFASSGDDTTPGQRADNGDGFVVELKRVLKTSDLRLVALARAVLEDTSGPGGAEEELERLRIAAMKAEGDYQYAVQKREVGEITFKEFTEATLPRELATADAEIEIAQTDLARAQELNKQATGQLGKISSQLELQRATLGLELAESHKKVLVEYTRPSRTRELASQLARARSEEQGKKAEWELLKRRMETLQESGTTTPRPNDVEQRIIALIDRAIPIEERIRAGLAQVSNRAEIAEPHRKDFHNLTNELGTIIDEAEAVMAEDDLGRLKPLIQRAARRLRSPTSK